MLSLVGDVDAISEALGNAVYLLFGMDGGISMCKKIQSVDGIVCMCVCVCSSALVK